MTMSKASRDSTNDMGNMNNSDNTDHQSQKKKKKSLFSMEDLISTYTKPEKNKYVSREFQDYGYRLACEMGEETKKGMYIKMAKTTDRVILERARSFVMDAPKVRNRGRLFMWAVGRIKKGKDLTGD